jgi:hypothetical protein
MTKLSASSEPPFFQDMGTSYWIKQSKEDGQVIAVANFDASQQWIFLRNMVPFEGACFDVARARRCSAQDVCCLVIPANLKTFKDRNAQTSVITFEPDPHITSFMSVSSYFALCLPSSASHARINLDDMACLIFNGDGTEPPLYLAVWGDWPLIIGLNLFLDRWIVLESLLHAAMRIEFCQSSLFSDLDKSFKKLKDGCGEAVAQDAAMSLAGLFSKSSLESFWCWAPDSCFFTDKDCVLLHIGEECWLVNTSADFGAHDDDIVLDKFSGGRLAGLVLNLCPERFFNEIDVTLGEKCDVICENSIAGAKFGKFTMRSKNPRLEAFCFSYTRFGSFSLPHDCESLTLKAFAFYGATILGLKLPAVLKVIPRDCFARTHIDSITFGEGSQLSSIEMNAFANSDLNELTLPNSVENVGEHMLADCFRLSRVTLSESLSHIPAFFCSACSALTQMDFPSSVIVIGASSFSRCSSLRIVKFGENLEEIEDCAFEYTSLRTICFPASLRRIALNAFDETPLARELPPSLINLWTSMNATFPSIDLQAIVPDETSSESQGIAAERDPLFEVVPHDLLPVGLPC